MGSRLEKTSNAVRKRIENHSFDNEEGEEYKASTFGGYADYFRRKRIKLQNLDHEIRSQSADKPQLFKGIVVYVNGYTQPSMNDLHKLVVQHGGGFMQFLDGKTMVTHIVASNLTPKKAVEFKRYRIVKPAWIVESVSGGRLLPWDEFRLLNEGAGQRVLGFDGGNVVSQVDTKAKGYREQSDSSWYAAQLKTKSQATQSPVPSDATFKTPGVPRRPPSPQPEPGSSHLDAQGSANPDTSPLPNSTPQLLRDLRDLRDYENFQNEIESGIAWEQEDDNESADDRLEHGPAESAMPNGFHEGEEEKPADRPTIDDGSPEVPEPVGADTENECGEYVDNHGLSTTTPNLDSPERRELTAEEHNALLLADPRIRKSSAVNPEFLDQYYRESRLHHLSTWKADLKAQMQALAEAQTPSQKSRQKRPLRARRYVLHVDFDCFFAAVSLKKHPEYKDLPVAVAHGAGNSSEIASCNYAARKFGITNGSWMRKALELCPNLKVVPYDFPAYEEASRHFYEAIVATGGVVQSVSIDEALVDVSHLCWRDDDATDHEQGADRADEIGHALREQVREKTGCEVSVGIGANILLAKVALRRAKPAGQYHLRPEEVLEFIGKLQVQALPGVAWSIGGKLEEIGIKTVNDIRETTREKLINTLGPKTGEKLWEYSRGIDRKEVGDVEIRKSISAEVSWGVRFVTQEQVDEFIESLCTELEKRLVRERVKGRQLSLKVMRRAADAPLDAPKHLGHGKCDSYNKSVLLGVATHDSRVLTRETLSMLRGFGFSPGVLRGIGVQMQKLEPLKAGHEGKEKSSQRRLQFKLDDKTTTGEQAGKTKDFQTDDPIEDLLVTPKKQKAPEKIAFGADQLNASTPSRKPLNILGTQFVLPTQVDPDVLAELPADIRERLTKHVRSGNIKDRLLSAVPSMTALPNQSQLDPEVLKALPQDVRSEIMEFYQLSPTNRKAVGIPPLAQSPQKKRPVPAPTKRRGRGGGISGTRGGKKGNSSLTQANFIANRIGNVRGDTPTTDTDNDDAESIAAAAPVLDQIDSDFLDALPDDIRLEVLAEQRQLRMQSKSGLSVAASSRKRQAAATAKAKESEATPIQQFLQLPPRPPKPVFTSRKLSALPDLRVAMSDWVREFTDDGPYPEDTEALCKYLAKVVCEESDMSKAVAIVKWLTWLLDEIKMSRSSAMKKWRDAVKVVTTAVQDAVRERGLGRLDL